MNTHICIAPAKPKSSEALVAELMIFLGFFLQTSGKTVMKAVNHVNGN